jgi:hypothetical protein
MVKGLCARPERFLFTALEILVRFLPCAAFFEGDLLAEALRAGFALRAAGFFLAGAFFFFAVAIIQKGAFPAPKTEA